MPNREVYQLIEGLSGKSRLEKIQVLNIRITALHEEAKNEFLTAASVLFQGGVTGFIGIEMLKAATRPLNQEDLIDPGKLLLGVVLMTLAIYLGRGGMNSLNNSFETRSDATALSTVLAANAIAEAEPN